MTKQVKKLTFEKALRAWEPAKGKRQKGIPQLCIDKHRFPGVVAKSEFMKMKRPPRKWAVDGLIPEGLTILAAGKSVGKTWLALNIALDIAEGRPVLGKIEAQQGPSLYLSLEDD